MNLVKKGVALAKKSVSTAKSTVIALSVLLATSVTNLAHAAVPTEASAAITALITDAGAMLLEFWPVTTAVVIGLILFKLFKKGASAAT